MFLQLIVLVLSLLVTLQLLHERLIRKTWFAWNGQPSLYSRPCIDALPPLEEAGKAFQIDSRKEREVDPREVGDIRDGVFAANEILVVFQTCIENAEQTLGLANISLRWIGYPLFRKAVEVVRLALHRTQPAVLPCNPLLA